MIANLDNILIAVSGISSLVLQKPVTHCEKLVGSKWVEVSPILVGVSAAGVCVAYNKVFVFGGRVSENQETDLIQIYNIQVDIWTKMHDLKLPQQISQIQAVLIEDQSAILLFGGHLRKTYWMDFQSITTRGGPNKVVCGVNAVKVEDHVIALGLDGKGYRFSLANNLWTLLHNH